jgi:hypothetical protein
MQGATIVENSVRGVPRVDSLGRRNLAGGIAATVGNAHAVERMTVGHSIVAGNTVQEIGGVTYAHDLFTGSLMHFDSAGYNRFGVLDFSQILVPVGEWGWGSLSRRHYPKVDDADGMALADVVDLATGVTVEPTIASAGVDAGNPVVLHYAPAGTAVDRIPTSSYRVQNASAQYDVDSGATDDFLEIVLARIEQRYGLTGFAAAFQSDFEAFLQSVDSDSATAGVQPYTNPNGQPILTLAGTHFFGPAQTWPRELENHPYIHFWHRLDAALEARDIPGMGPELLGDAAWQRLFSSGPLTENPHIRMSVNPQQFTVSPLAVDQLGAARPSHSASDIGAIEAR